jgi:hypothetical protein
MSEPPGQRSRALAVGAELAVEATAAEIVGEFRRAGIRSILLKGPSLARWLYAPSSTRTSVDVDLLVATADREAAEEVLVELGFIPFPRNDTAQVNRHAHAWEREPDPVWADLHLSLPGVRVSDEDAWRGLSQGTDELVVGGVEVEVLGPPARAMHVALHAAQHGVGRSSGVEDLARALDRLPLAVWRSAAELAERLDATAAFVAGLRMLPPGEELRGRLGLPRGTTVEVALRASTPPDLSLGLHRLAVAPGLRHKVAFGGRKLFPPAAWMRAWLPLARRGRLGLAAAYVWRPLWLLWRAPAAVRALRKARQESRKSL